MTTQGDNSSELIDLNQESTGRAGEEPGKLDSWEPPKPRRRHIGIKPYRPKNTDSGLMCDSFSEDEEVRPRQLRKALRIDLWSRKMISLQYEQELLRSTRWLRWLAVAVVIGMVFWGSSDFMSSLRDERGRIPPWALPMLVAGLVWVAIDSQGRLNNPDWQANKAALWWVVLCLSPILILFLLAVLSLTR